MAHAKRARLFRNGASQAVRLPAEFRFAGTEVFVSRDEQTGDLILSSRPGARLWDEFFRLYPPDTEERRFMADRPMNQLPADKHIFDKDIFDAASHKR